MMTHHINLYFYNDYIFIFTGKEWIGVCHVDFMEDQDLEHIIQHYYASREGMKVIQKRLFNRGDRLLLS